MTDELGKRLIATAGKMEEHKDRLAQLLSLPGAADEDDVKLLLEIVQIQSEALAELQNSTARAVTHAERFKERTAELLAGVELIEKRLDSAQFAAPEIRHEHYERAHRLAKCVLGSKPGV